VTGLTRKPSREIDPMDTHRRPPVSCHPPKSAALLMALVWIAAAAAQAVEQGQKAPSFAAPGMAGGVVSLDSYRGKVVFLDFWASWCGPCAQALPALETLRGEFPAQDFQVVAVNVDSESAAAKAFVQRRPIGYPTALDPAGKIPARFGVQAMPTSFLIDRHGVIRHVQQGFRPSDVTALRERIQELVAAGR
jgi:peroxiredoxin